MVTGRVGQSCAEASAQASRLSSAPRGARIMSTSIARLEALHPGHIGIEHADRATLGRAWAVPDCALAGDLDLRHVAALHRGINRECRALRVEPDQRATHAGVADPQIVITVRPD